MKEDRVDKDQREAITLFHVSDLHFHQNKKENKTVTKRLQALKSREEFKRSTTKLVVTGDITDDGGIDQYKNAITALRQFGKEHVFVVPGNHDYGALGNFYMPRCAQRFADRFDREFTQDCEVYLHNLPSVMTVKCGGLKVMLFGLDSNLETEDPFDFACGQIGNAQLKALNTMLKRAPDEAVRVVCLHHHCFEHTDPFIRLKDAEKLAATLFARADLVLFGHKHQQQVWLNRLGAVAYVASDALFQAEQFFKMTIYNRREIRIEKIDW